MRRLRLSYKKNTKTTVFSQPQRNHIDAHLYLLPGEKTPSAVRRMRRRSAVRLQECEKVNTSSGRLCRPHEPSPGGEGAERSEADEVA